MKNFLEILLVCFFVLILIQYVILRKQAKKLRKGAKLLQERNADLSQQLTQAQKMESIGRLAGGVAHDFNNMLAGIKGAAEFLRIKLGKGNPLSYYPELIIDTCRRSANLTSQLLVFSRNKGTSHEVLDLHENIRESLMLLEHGLDKRIRIKRELKAEEHVVMGNPDLIQNTIFNLAFNAKDAMPNGGNILIKTRNVRLNEKQIADSTHNVRVGKYVELMIKDAGVGIPKDIQDKIFDPFFTTKEIGKGNGMGLPTVYGIVTEHNGTIRLKSSRKGTSFFIYFPVIQSKVKKKKKEEDVAKLKAKIMIVDDEKILLELLKEILNHMGSEVITVSNPLDAADVYKNNKGIDVVMIDVIMPNKNGVELYGDLRKINPDIKVMFMSGYNEDPTIGEMVRTDSNVAFVSKPYSVGNVAAKLSQMLGKK